MPQTHADVCTIFYATLSCHELFVDNSLFTHIDFLDAFGSTLNYACCQKKR